MQKNVSDYLQFFLYFVVVFGLILYYIFFCLIECVYTHCVLEQSQKPRPSIDNRKWQHSSRSSKHREYLADLVRHVTRSSVLTLYAKRFTQAARSSQTHSRTDKIKQIAQLNFNLTLLLLKTRQLTTYVLVQPTQIRAKQKRRI